VITTTVVAAGEPEAVRVTPLMIADAMERVGTVGGGGGDIQGGISDGGHNTFKARQVVLICRGFG
jgi:hypothetical protein